MRKVEISYTKNETERSGTIEYPDLWCFCFNPNYVVITLDDTTANSELTLTIAAGERSYDIYVNLYQGAAKVYISKILQLLFDDVEHDRAAGILLTLKDGDDAMTNAEMSFVAVWGGLQIGEQFGKYGAFVYNGKNLSHVRNVVWFRKFPFYVSLFRAEGGEITTASFDGKAADAQLRVFRTTIDEITTGELPALVTTSAVLSSPTIVLNSTNGVIYALEGDAAYEWWTTNGGTQDASEYKAENGEIRDDIEFSYQEKIIHWNNVTKQVDYATMGNARVDGIFDLNPAITFPDVEKKAQYNVCLEKVTSAIFNMNFNFPFPDTSKMLNEVVNLRISDAQDGLYLRWIDRFGLLQSYLFVEGTSTIKAKASSDTLHIERTFNGMNLGKLERHIEITNTESIKCSAVNLPKDVLAYVKTIINAPLVDLYYGKMKGGTELWLPVLVSDGSYSTDPKTQLSDYEITIQLPENVSQTL